MRKNLLFYGCPRFYNRRVMNAAPTPRLIRLARTASAQGNPALAADLLALAGPHSTTEPDALTVVDHDGAGDLLLDTYLPDELSREAIRGARTEDVAGFYAVLQGAL